MHVHIIRAGDEVDHSNDKAGFVYIIKPCHANIYKIGETDNVERRLAQLKKKFDFDIELVCAVRSSSCFQLEQRLHLDYSRYHIGGDWFALTDEVLYELVAWMRGEE